MDRAFPLHDETTAPEAARPALATTKQNFGMIPNLERVMAGAPALLQAYCAAEELFESTSLSPIERQVVYQTANFENECDYCVPWHTYLSAQAKMGAGDIEALRNGSRLSGTKLEALRNFARRLIHTRGKISPNDLEDFINAGYDDSQALEVVLGLAVKTMSNYTNSIAGTPLDTIMRKYSWRKPKIAMRHEENVPTLARVP